MFNRGLSLDSSFFLIFISDLVNTIRDYFITIMKYEDDSKVMGRVESADHLIKFQESLPFAVERNHQMRIVEGN